MLFNVQTKMTSVSISCKTVNEDDGQHISDQFQFSED